MWHPFFDLIAGDGEEAGSLIRRFVAHDGVVAHQFAQLLSAIIAKTDDADVRIVLVENLWDEHGAGNPDRIHARLFDQMAASIGVTSFSPIDSVASQRFIDVHYGLLDRSLLAAVAAFCYANEFLCLHEFPRIEARCQEIFPAFDGAYFRENSRVDALHTRRLEAALRLLARSKDSFEVARDGCLLALEARAAIYDRVVAEHVAAH